MKSGKTSLNFKDQFALRPFLGRMTIGKESKMRILPSLSAISILAGFATTCHAGFYNIYRQSISLTMRAAVTNELSTKSCSLNTAAAFAMSAVRIDPIHPEYGLDIDFMANVDTELGQAFTAAVAGKNDCGGHYSSDLQIISIAQANCGAVGYGSAASAGVCIYHSQSVTLTSNSQTLSCCIPLAAIASGSSSFTLTTNGTIELLTTVTSRMEGALPTSCYFERTLGESDFALGGARHQGILVMVEGQSPRLFQTMSSADGAHHNWGNFVDNEDGTFSVTDTFTKTGSATILSVPFVVSDKDLDVNGDGAVDSDDVTDLTGQIGSTNADLLSRFNFYSESGQPAEIDANDVAILDAMISGGLGHGQFGDINRDGIVDCLDSYGARSYFGHDLTSTQYHVEADFNLDGVLDQSDKEAFFAVVNFADLNQDGIVDDADFTIFVSAYDNYFDETGDLNGDDITDDSDFSKFVERYNALTC